MGWAVVSVGLMVLGVSYLFSILFAHTTLEATKANTRILETRVTAAKLAVQEEQRLAERGINLDELARWAESSGMRKPVPVAAPEIESLLDIEVVALGTQEAE